MTALLGRRVRGADSRATHPAPGGEVVLRLSGELDLAAADDLRERCRRAGGQRARLVVVDLTDVTFLDCAALGVLCALLADQRRDGGDVAVRGACPRVARVFALTGLAGAFAVAEAPA